MGKLTLFMISKLAFMLLNIRIYKTVESKRIQFNLEFPQQTQLLLKISAYVLI